MNSMIKKFKIVECVRVTGWNTVMAICEIFDDLIVMDSMWNDSFKRDHPDIYPLDLSDRKTWSTFDQCANFKFEYLDSEHFMCTAYIYDGDSIYGSQRRLRFTAEMKIPVEHIGLIGDWIDAAFSRKLRSGYEKFLRDEAGKWMNAYAKELIRNENI